MAARKTATTVAITAAFAAAGALSEGAAQPVVPTPRGQALVATRSRIDLPNGEEDDRPAGTRRGSCPRWRGVDGRVGGGHKCRGARQTGRHGGAKARGVRRQRAWTAANRWSAGSDDGTGGGASGRPGRRLGRGTRGGSLTAGLRWGAVGMARMAPTEDGRTEAARAASRG